MINDKIGNKIDISVLILFSFGAKSPLLMYLERVEEGSFII